MRTKLDASQVPGWLQSRLERNAHAGVAAIGITVQQHRALMVQRTATAQPRPALNTGRLRASWRAWSLPTAATALTKATGPVIIGRVFNTAPYAPAIEDGVAPGKIPLPRKDSKGRLVPFGSLVEWALRKMLTGKGAMKRPKATRAQRKGSRKRASRQSWRRGMAYAIAIGVQRSLHRKGIQGRHIMGAPEAIGAARQMLVANLERQLTLEASA